VLPTLTPLTFDPAHPFPFISNRSLSLAVLTQSDDEEEPTFTRVKIPPNRPRLVPVEKGRRYVLIEDVIRANLDRLVPNADVVDSALFRLTRNAEVRRNEEVAEDLIEMIEEVLEQRRFATVVRLEIESDPDPRILETLREQLDLDSAEIYELGGPLDYRGFASLADLDRPALQHEPWEPKPHARLQETQSAPLETDGVEEPLIFDHIDEGDILLHHPYHSFEGTVQRFLSEAAEDPDVLAVKAAIYRTASDSQVIQSLIDAAENGKQVAVMVELKARFDEQNNLEWVRRLEENGIHVAYGTIGLKTHTKTALVVRESGDGVTLYSHVGTGNYHSETAKGYVDLGLLTADRDVGHDLVTLFNSFTGPGLDEEYRKLLVAPITIRERMTRYIRREAEHARSGREGRIVIKVNGLEDPAMVEELYRAAMAGVEIDLIVRDICRLRPGIEGVTENVTVHSVVGQFLEHSRIFYFENSGDPEYYLGSADLMTRNLDNRVEAVTPVEDPDIRRQLRYNLDLVLSDNRRRWVMNPDGSYDHCHPAEAESTLDVQAVLKEEAAAARAQGVGRGIPIERGLETDLLVESAADAGTDPDPEAAERGHGPLERYDDHWYAPASDIYEYAVRTPDGDRRYLKTETGAVELLERLYGES
jgi:polyphosphate kinase